jgi:large subunit ribosomal protein L10
MSVLKQQREAQVAEISEKFSRAQSAILVDYRGLNVAAMTKLRRNLRAAGVELKVYKNTLTRIALHGHDQTGLDSSLEGPTAIAFGYEDAIAPAKLLVDFAKEHKQLEFKAGLVDGRVVSVDDIKALAALPSREELIAKLVGSMASPLRGLVNVLSGPPRNLVYVLEAIRKQKEEQAA